MERLVEKYAGGYEEYITAKKLQETNLTDAVVENPRDEAISRL